MSAATLQTEEESKLWRSQTSHTHGLLITTPAEIRTNQHLPLSSFCVRFNGSYVKYDCGKHSAASEQTNEKTFLAQFRSV